MTGEQQDELGRLQAAPFIEIAKYVEGLLEAAYQYGYEEGFDESEKNWRAH